MHLGILLDIDFSGFCMHLSLIGFLKVNVYTLYTFV